MPGTVYPPRPAALGCDPKGPAATPPDDSAFLEVSVETYPRALTLLGQCEDTEHMRVSHSEPADIDPGCEIRLGVASWDDGSLTTKSVKFTWFNSDGKASRGGEFPVNALPQALDFAIRKGFLRLVAHEETEQG